MFTQKLMLNKEIISLINKKILKTNKYDVILQSIFRYSDPNEERMNCMWDGEKSISLSKLCIRLFMGALVATVVSAPWLTRWFLEFSRGGERGTEGFFLATIYMGAIPAGYLLYNLFRLLHRIEAGQVFIPKNVESLRYISWSCFVGSGIALLSTVYYIPWVFLAAAAAFMGLIVRVVKNVVAQAVLLQDEVDSVI